MSFEKTGKEKFGAGGIGRLYINDEKVGEGEIPRTVRFMYANYEGFDIGVDIGTPSLANDSRAKLRK